MLSLLRTFDGRDFVEWEATARHVINATGCQIALGNQPSPTMGHDGNETDESYKTHENWDNQNAQAYGNLMLHVSPDIRNLAVKAKKETMKDFLNWLKTQYGTTSIAAAYTDVVAVNKLQIPGDCDPTPALDRLLALFTRLEDNKLLYPESIRAMTLLAKLLVQMEEIAQNYNQKTSDAISLTFAIIHNDAIMNWQQCSSKGKQRQQQGNDVRKLSNIQHKGKDPQFPQQQQLQQTTGPSKPRGKHGSRGRNKQKQQNGQQRPHAHLVQPSTLPLLPSTSAHVAGCQC